MNQKNIEFWEDKLCGIGFYLTLIGLPLFLFTRFEFISLLLIFFAFISLILSIILMGIGTRMDQKSYNEYLKLNKLKSLD